ncbi:PD-(D/E)XK nuclease family protein [Nocardia salmonicida]|uniref:RecB family exonuclease n=1 Tax=Nocardia salmonicida TaxID=53431 RepID=UPI0033C5EF2F
MGRWQGESDKLPTHRRGIRIGNPRSLSVSQLNTYTKCPQAWHLERQRKAWQRPAAWLAQGTAAHAAYEAYERSGRTLTLEELEEIYRTVYAEEIAKYSKETPNHNWWFASGPYSGPVDIERRFKIGLEQVAKYPVWYDKHPEEVIWVAPDGTPGIELGFDFDLDGVRIRGFIDALIWDRRYNRIVVRDNKTGKSPGGDMQLGVYAVAVEETYDVEKPNTGDYWMATSGSPTKPYDLSDWNRDRLVNEFHQLAEDIAAEKFDPKPEDSKCKFCSVATSCPIFLG